MNTVQKTKIVTEVTDRFITINDVCGITGKSQTENKQFLLASEELMYEPLDEVKSFTKTTLIPVNWCTRQWAELCKKPYRERLVIAAALIMAEINQLDNQK